MEEWLRSHGLDPAQVQWEEPADSPVTLDERAPQRSMISKTNICAPGLADFSARPSLRI